MFHNHNFVAGRPVRFGSGGAILHARNGEGLTIEQIAAHVPAVLAETAHESRSEKFVAIPSRAVVEALMREGFQIVEARQGGSRIEGKREFTKHRLRMRHPSLGTERTLGQLTPEIVLTNGNDGTSAYWLEKGLFRLVCLNGLMVKDKDVATIKVRHSGRPDQVVQDVIEASYQVVNALPSVFEDAGTMEARTVRPSMMADFAREALRLRWEDGEAPINAAQLLQPRRDADLAPNVWNLMNIVQENLIRGGQSYRTSPTDRNPHGMARQVSAVRDATADSNINRAIWAEAMALAAA